MRPPRLLRCAIAVVIGSLVFGIIFGTKLFDVIMMCLIMLIITVTSGAVFGSIGFDLGSLGMRVPNELPVPRSTPYPSRPEPPRKPERETTAQVINLAEARRELRPWEY